MGNGTWDSDFFSESSSKQLIYCFEQVFLNISLIRKNHCSFYCCSKLYVVIVVAKSSSRSRRVLSLEDRTTAVGHLIKEIYLKDNIKWPPVMFIPMIANMSPVTEFINNLIGIIENINLLFNVFELHLAFGAAEAELHGYPKLKRTLTSV